MKTIITIQLMALLAVVSACSSKSETFPDSGLNFASLQTKRLSEQSIEQNRLPRTSTPQGDIHWAKTEFDWTEGFFPGTCWNLYQYTGDKEWAETADLLQSKIKDHRFLTTNHDLGFVFNCSYGTGYQLTKNRQYKEVLVDAANSLITRFNPTVGCIQSWDVDKGWQSKRDWEYPVIIDNMMNLELLFTVSQLTGDTRYKQIAITHANTTMKNHFRPDHSSYHVVDYDPSNGNVRHKHTAQGYAHESAWARGQAWGLYGFTVCYRFTHDPKYLRQAEAIAEFIFSHPNLPNDLVPYWDFDAPKIPNEPRDASAAAVIASALVELDTYTSANYKEKAEAMLKNLASETYTAKLGENNDFVLKHSVGSIPHNSEIDVPLNYADYYYIEALLRLKAAL